MAHDESIHDRRNFRTEEGFEGTNVPTDFTIPPCGLEDVDRAVYNLFNKDTKFEVKTNNQLKKVPTIFATGERFVLTKRRKPIRDKNGTFILPLISIRRTGIDQSMEYQMGMGQDPGELTIKHRLSANDSAYQNLVNKRALKNQDNVTTVSHFLNGTKIGDPGKIATRRLQTDTNPVINGLLGDVNDNNNIHEFITMPFPHFYTAKYEVVFWAQHTEQINQMIEKLMFSYTAQGNHFKIVTDKGYYFVAFVNDEISPDSNVNDFSNQERIIKYSFTMNVPAYLLVPKIPGEQIQLRRFLSSPQITFETILGKAPASQPSKSDIGTGDPDKFTLDDIYVKDQHGDNVVSDRTITEYTTEKVENPFTGKSETRLVRVKTRNQRKGETVTGARDLSVEDTVTF